MIAPVARAQTYTVIHNFNGSDGSDPTSTLIFDRAGNLYGTTSAGGAARQGVVFQLKHTPSGGWIYTPIHQFNGNSGSGDGANPIDYGGLTLASDGTIYGTTNGGGILGCDGQGYCGTVFRVQPPATACTTALCSWLLTITYKFNPQSGAEFPESNVIFDAAGNLYGTNNFGNFSEAYELSLSDGNWVQNSYVLDAGTNAGVVLDKAGNLYGVATSSSHRNGFVFELTPSGNSWTETILYNFTGGDDGASPFGGLIFDSAGNLYGSTQVGGSKGGGTVFQLSPSGAGWNLSTLCSFGSGTGYYGPQSALTMDAAGNLYGTTNGDGSFGDGMVFKASPSGNSWTCTDLFDFNGDLGLFPVGGVTVGANGNLYGTATQTESHGYGVVWEITP
jgi:uncharacterized repeat protein (TIGR03803 family)